MTLLAMRASTSVCVDGVTSSFVRPEASNIVPMRVTLHYAEAESDTRTVDEGRGLRTSDDSNEDGRAPAQVHLSPHAPGSVTVVWTTRESLILEDDEATRRVVEYSVEENGRVRQLEATYASASYTAQLCIGNSNALHPRMGKTPAVDEELLARAANTSVWADSDASNYRIVRTFEDVVPSRFWDSVPYDKGVCLSYANPDAQYQSPIIHTATMNGLASGRQVEFRLPGESRTRTFLAPKVAQENGNQVTRIAVVGIRGKRR